MGNVNTWVGYFSLSLIMIFGILFLAGMIGSFGLTTRFLVSGAILVYIILRLVMLHVLSDRRQTKERFQAPGSSQERGDDRPNIT